MKQTQKRILWLLAAGYAAIMVWLLFYREINQEFLPYSAKLRQHINLVPFSTISRFLHGLQRVSRPAVVRSSIVNLLGNVLLFLPMGIFPPLLWESMQRFWRTTLLSAGIVITVEIAQLLLLVGWCDIDDLILNLAGASLGYGLYALIHKCSKAAPSDKV